MLTEVDPEGATSLASDGIEVRRAPGAEARIVAAARAWARAFDAIRRQEATPGEGAELALYDALVEVDALKSAELALYEAVVASEPR